jgi:hypothetical protein
LFVAKQYTLFDAYHGKIQVDGNEDVNFCRRCSVTTGHNEKDSLAQKKAGMFSMLNQSALGPDQMECKVNRFVPFSAFQL